MRETIRDFPYNPELRRTVAKQIHFARYLDRSKRYITDRSLNEYLKSFAGLKHFLEYAKSHHQNGPILDIGSGTTRAISELSESPLGENLTFIASVLTRPPETGDRVSRVVSTSAELLNGIQDDSIAGIISCYGIAYSSAPELAIRRMDQVLVSGGALKAVFYGQTPDKGSLANFHGLQTSHRFKEELFTMNYDISSLFQGPVEVVLAIKPGGTDSISASELLALDKNVTSAV